MESMEKNVPIFSSVEETLQWLKDNPYFCAKPFYSTEISQQGLYSWCCHWDDDRYTKEDFDNFDRSIFYGDNPIKECNFCYNVEKYRPNSERITDSVYSLFQKRELFNTKNDYMILRLDNVCNVACRMCNEGNSSLFSKKIGKSLVYEIPDEDWVYIREDLKKVKHITLFGGETFLSRRLIEMLNIDHQIENIGIQTNCTVYKPEILDKLSEIDIVDLGLSIDGIGSVNEYTRWPSKWDRVTANLEKFFKYDFNFIVNPVINIYTAFYMDEHMDFYYPYMKDGVDIIISPFFCFDPDWMSLKRLPQPVLDVIKAKMESCLDHPIFIEFPLQTDNLLDGYKAIISACEESEYTPEKWAEFKAQTDRWNIVQSMIMEDYLPEFHRLIKDY